MPDLIPLGDRAWLARFATEADARRWANEVGRQEASEDVVLAYRSVSVHFDPDRTDGQALKDRLAAIAIPRGELAVGRTVVVPVLYDGEDLAEVSSTTGLSPQEIIRLHTESPFDVFAIGFQPGFPYAGYLPEPLQSLPRRTRPRLRVPAGSVAIAAGQTGIYPSELPGGWNLLGRTPLKIVDMTAGLFPIRPGDRLKFQAIEHDEFQERLGEMLT